MLHACLRARFSVIQPFNEISADTSRRILESSPRGWKSAFHPPTFSNVSGLLTRRVKSRENRPSSSSSFALERCKKIPFVEIFGPFDPANRAALDQFTRPSLDSRRQLSRENLHFFLSSRIDSFFFRGEERKKGSLYNPWIDRDDSS